jgi:hypothetical protein
MSYRDGFRSNTERCIRKHAIKGSYECFRAGQIETEFQYPQSQRVGMSNPSNFRTHPSAFIKERGSHYHLSVIIISNSRFQGHPQIRSNAVFPFPTISIQMQFSRFPTNMSKAISPTTLSNSFFEKSESDARSRKDCPSQFQQSPASLIPLPSVAFHQNPIHCWHCALEARKVRGRQSS